MINKRKNILERGITLIALVVTIIVLLILAGVTLNIAIDNGGLISRARQAKDTYAKAEQNDLETLTRIDNYMERQAMESHGNIGINYTLIDPELNHFYGDGNRVILGFSNIYDESENVDTLIRQIYNVSRSNFRSVYQNQGHEDEYIKDSYEWTAGRRGFSFEEVLGAALVNTGVKNYTVRVTTDDGATEVALYRAGYSEDLYFELIGNVNEEKEYKVTITDSEGNESYRWISATKREIRI